LITPKVILFAARNMVNLMSPNTTLSFFIKNTTVLKQPTFHFFKKNTTLSKQPTVLYFFRRTKKRFMRSIFHDFIEDALRLVARPCFEPTCGSGCGRVNWPSLYGLKMRPIFLKIIEIWRSLNFGI
jgi:hypothetical protein